jgi:hypothetical protein
VENWWQLDGWQRQAAVWVAVLLGTVGLGAVIGSRLGIDGGAGSTRSAYSRLDALAPGTLQELPKAKPTTLEKPLAIGSRNAGVAVVAVSEPDSVDTSDGRRRAPDGGSLVVFKIGDWSCQETPCKPWTTLKPKVQADDLVKDLPTHGDTFVIAVAAGTGELRLVVDDAGYRQSVSLLGDNPGAKNITLLSQHAAAKKLTLNKSVRLTEQTDIQFRGSNGALVNQFVRNAVVDYAQRTFFWGDLLPSSPGKAFLVVSTSYAYPGREQRYAFAASEVTFVTDDGKSYPATGSQTAGSSLLSFEIPGSVTSGDLVFGGSTGKTASNGVPYTSTVSTARVPIKFR